MNIQLSISLLVSDRMETLGKCLASLKPLLRELDSELIAVFTAIYIADHSLYMV